MDDATKRKRVEYAAFYVSQRIIETRVVRFLRYFREHRIDMEKAASPPEDIDAVIKHLRSLSTGTYLRPVSIEREKKIELFLPNLDALLPLYLYLSKIDGALCLLYAAKRIGQINDKDTQQLRREVIVAPLDGYLKSITLPKKTL